MRGQGKVSGAGPAARTGSSRAGAAQATCATWPELVSVLKLHAQARRCEVAAQPFTDAASGTRNPLSRLGAEAARQLGAPPEAHECLLELLTGRTHQIRAQLSAVGCPLLGDSLYAPLASSQLRQASGWGPGLTRCRVCRAGPLGCPPQARRLRSGAEDREAWLHCFPACTLCACCQPAAAVRWGPGRLGREGAGGQRQQLRPAAGRARRRHRPAGVPPGVDGGLPGRLAGAARRVRGRCAVVAPGLRRHHPPDLGPPTTTPCTSQLAKFGARSSPSGTHVAGSEL